MPRRKIILASGEFYHVFNKGLNLLPIFSGKKEADYFMELIKYYLWENPPIRFSLFKDNKNLYKQLKNNKLISLLCFILMPNHFHLILKQEKDQGIKTYVQKISNSFSHYFNFKNKRKGSLFESSFKVVKIETEKQLIHLSRYIHLNPVTAYLVENPIDYLYSSYSGYIGKENLNFIDTAYILNQFKNKKSYEKFVLNQKDYQRKLGQIKHLIVEKD